MEVKEGQLLAGKYRVERILGEGGMGVVLAALHVQLDQRVAIKLLRPAIAAALDATNRFLREARAAARIQGEHVARVMDVGTLESGAPYIVMELLDGKDLGQVVQTCGSLPVADAVDYVVQASEAIAEAHALGIVHRDLKPPNLFLTRRADGSPLIKVLDFGISKATSLEPPGAGPVVTATGLVMGSPHYMAPEQFRNTKHVDARADVWSLGVVLYELLTATRPFEAEGPWELMNVIHSEAFTPLGARRSDVPGDLQGIVSRCLQKDPARRYQNLGELALDLAPFGHASTGPLAERIGRIAGVPRSTTAPSAPSGEIPPLGVAVQPRTLVATSQDRASPALPTGHQWGRRLLAGATLLALASAVLWVSRTWWSSAPTGDAEEARMGADRENAPRDARRHTSPLGQQGPPLGPRQGPSQGAPAAMPPEDADRGAQPHIGAGGASAGARPDGDRTPSRPPPPVSKSAGASPPPPPARREPSPPRKARSLPSKSSPSDSNVFDRRKW